MDRTYQFWIKYYELEDLSLDMLKNEILNGNGNFEWTFKPQEYLIRRFVIILKWTFEF